MVLAEYLHLPPQLLNLGHPHDFAPLIVYLHAVDACALLLTQLLLTQANTGQLLQVACHQQQTGKQAVASADMDAPSAAHRGGSRWVQCCFRDQHQLKRVSVCNAVAGEQVQPPEGSCTALVLHGLQYCVLVWQLPACVYDF
jgi:hypothetical protein